MTLMGEKISLWPSMSIYLRQRPEMSLKSFDACIIFMIFLGCLTSKASFKIELRTAGETSFQALNLGFGILLR